MTPKEETRFILQQLTEVLALLPAKVYAQPLEIFSGSSVGQHFRHIYNFYEILFNNWQKGIIDYAARRRKTTIEKDPALATSSFEHLTTQLHELDENTTLQILSDFGSDQSDERRLVSSTLGRELAYAFDHAIHHLAIIKIGLKNSFPSIPLPEKLGVAPSTLRDAPHKTPMRKIENAPSSPAAQT